MSAVSTRQKAQPAATLPSVEIGDRRYNWAECTPLHRSIEGDIAEWLMLSPDGGFAVVELFGARGYHAIRQVAPIAAKRYLVERGEGDMVEDFPALFVESSSSWP